MNIDPAFNSDAASEFSLQSQDAPIVIGQPLNYAKRMARLVSIKKSHKISDRVSWSDVELTVVSGRCDVHFEEAVKSLSAQDSVCVPAMVEHSIVAVSDVRLIVSFQIEGNSEKRGF